jgi:CRISP-associated protein Cas1
MIKRTLFFENPAYLSTKNEQLVVNYPDEEKSERTVPIEDIGLIVLEHQQITITNGLLQKLSDNKTAIITCNQQHLPCSLMLPLHGHTEMTERLKYQLNASQPLKKNLWAQTITAKIENQASLLAELGKEHQRLKWLAKQVQSGDSGNCEAQAAAYYWQHLFELPNFNREQHGHAPNHLLNYGYAILRAIVARALIGSGLLPIWGIWHRNKYNAYCLADDMMEPYRPYVDLIVYHITQSHDQIEELTTELKAELLQIAVMDVVIDGLRSPLMVAVSRTSSSLADCFAGVSRKISFPDYGG